MTDLVDETLRQWRSEPAIYGQSDCMLSIGIYLARTGHRDVTGRFAGKYKTAKGARGMMARNGGVAGLMSLAGAVIKTTPPARGDVVEVMWANDEHIGGLCTGDAVALRLEKGVVELSLRFVSIGGVWDGHRR